MLRYKILLFIIFIPLAFYTFWQSLRAFEFRYFLQRFAIYFGNTPKANGIWFHAASVGEVNAVIPLILKIQENHPDLPVTLSSNTISSAKVVKNQLPSAITQLYFPLDYKWAIQRIIRFIKPKAVFIVETEFWPNLFTQLHKNNIPLEIINGRISEKTLHTQKWLKNIYRQILPLATNIYTRSETDQLRFLTLGAKTEQTSVLGNIKFSATSNQSVEAITFERPYVLAASTRDDEEQLIVGAWLKSNHANHLLVIVPRHPQRLSEIINQLRPLKVDIAIRSKNEPVTNKTDIYIADTIGELKQFIAGSEFVLMGGSFVTKGGHNILEVAQMGKAVIFGPDMRSFTDEAKTFIEYNAGIQCELADLAGIFTQLLTNQNDRKNIENNAITLITENNNVEKYYSTISHYFPI